MTAITLESLGLTQAELQERVIEKISRDLLEREMLDEEGEPVGGHESPLAQKLHVAIKQRIDEGIARIAEKYVLPNVDKYLDNIILAETNAWGEARGQKLTLREYLVQRAEAYLREDVSFEGKSRAESGSSFWSKAQTRLTHLVHQHLHYTIETAMKEAVGNVNRAIVPALTATVKTKLEEIAGTLQVSVKTKG